MVAALLAGALGGCGPASFEDPVRLNIPILPQHRSVIVGVEEDGARPQVFAADIVDGVVPAVMWSFDPESTIEVTALLYDEPLMSSELEPGPLELVPPGDDTRSLPSTREIRQITVREARPTEWRQLDALPAPITSLRVADKTSCIFFLPNAISLGDSAEPASVLAMDDTWALVMTYAGKQPERAPEVFFVDGQQVIRQEVPVSLLSGYRRDDGEFWFGGQGGAIFRGQFTGSPVPHLELTAQGRVSSGEDVIDLSGAPDGDVEHFALTNNRRQAPGGTFEWFDGIRWYNPYGRRTAPHDATWVARGYGLFASFYRDQTVEGARDGVATEIVVSSVLLGSVTTVERIPGYGLVAGTSAGDVHVDRGDGQWERITGSTTQTIWEVHGYEDGIVYLRGDAVAQLPADGSICDDAALFMPDYEAQPNFDVVGEHIVVPLRIRESDPGQVGAHYVAWYQRQ